MASHALLLRLFLSPSFFSVHVALKYLLLYADNIGITYYLTHRLKELQVGELTDVWGFVCHLLVTRPTKSRALECFVIDIVQRSTHIALITLWFMQAALNDLSTSSRDSPSFAVCQRVLLKCHEIIFSDISSTTSGPYSQASVFSVTRRKKVKHHVEPALVGIAAILAGAPGMPRLTNYIGQVAIEQGYAEEGTDTRPSIAGPDDLAPPIVASPTPSEPDDQLEDDPDTPSTPESVTTPTMPHPPTQKFGIIPRRRTVAGARTVPSLPLHIRGLRKSPTIDDPLGQLDAIDSVPSSYHQSSPSLPSAFSARTPLRSALGNPADHLLEKYDQDAQAQLLRNHFCLSEVQFLLSLENICNRLLIVPKPARVSALRAELTALNHKLPAEVCLPLWCPGSDSSHGTHLSHPHHRIVRIPPGESVVLNSAERAPYLLLVEILNDDLNFEPSKKANKDVLRKIVLNEQERKGTPTSLGLSSSTFSRINQSSTDFDVTLRTDPPQEPQSAVSLAPPTPLSAEPQGDPDEEVDLIEQLYGSDQPLLSRMVDISESIVIPPTPKNKELDQVAWSRSSPLVSSTSTFGSSRLHERAPSLPMSRSTSTENGDKDPAPKALSLEDYSERMRTAAIMLAQLNAGISSSRASPGTPDTNPSKMKRTLSNGIEQQATAINRHKINQVETAAIRDRIMKEMLSLEEERVNRMQGNDDYSMSHMSEISGSSKTLEDESIIRRELNKVDPSAVVFSESWAAKKSRIRASSPYGHLAQWDCMSVIVKTGGDLRQEQLAVQLIHEFQNIWAEEKCACWVKHFRILITGSTSGLIETIKDAVSIHSIKKAEYAKRLAEGRLGHVTLLDHFKSTYGDPSSAKFARAQRNFAKSLAGYSIVTYLLQVKDRHNGNILLDREGHLIHIDFGFILSNTPGNIGFEAAPFKFPPEYLEVLGGLDSPAFAEFKRLFKEGFEAARKHCDRIITLVELMQRDSSLPCFAISGDQTANQLRDRFQPTLTHSLVGDYVDRLITSSLGSHWTRLYDSYQYYSQSIL